MPDESEKKLPLNLATLEIRKTELCFVTSTNPPTRTFFTQFCKFSNEELNAFNTSLNDFCNKLIDSGKQDTNKIRRGELVCARYLVDNFWYRATVMNRDKGQGKYTVMFIDYGNMEVVIPEDLTRVNPREFPVIERVPFGTQCFMQGSEELTTEECDRFLKILKNNYIMIKFTERQSSVQWKVGIPRHAYNVPFWNAYNPEDRQKALRPCSRSSDKEDTCNQTNHDVNFLPA